MPETSTEPSGKGDRHRRVASGLAPCQVAVIWIDWYAYHIARFRGLASDPELTGRVAGIELVGGVGVHAGLRFREDRSSDLPIHTLLPESSWRDAGAMRLALKLWQQLDLLNPQVLLIPGYYTVPGFVAAVWAKVHHCASVLMTESTYRDHARSPWKERVKSSVVRSLFDWAVVGGRSHVDYLRRLNFPADRVAQSYDVVDNEYFTQKCKSLRTQTASAFGLPPKYFLYVGRFAVEKNIERLLASWIAYRASGGTWPLVLVGDGPLRSTLRQIASGSSYASEVIFAGHTDSTKLPLYYAFAGCFVLPSLSEPWGLVVNEAMAAGLPVLVSSQCGCAEDLIESGRNGYLFDPQDVTEIAGYLRLLSDLEESERQGMGRHSAQVIRRYTPQNFGAGIAKIYRQTHLQSR